jgi:acyl-CoA thioesterase FadM
MGKVLYQNNHKVRPQILLLEKEFQTGISNGNTVGNLYYSNYYHWQSETMEHYLYHLVPEIMISNGRKGDFITLEANVKHLQEAMPFETILVQMFVDQIYENGFRFYFEYYSIEGKAKRKLAFGSNSVIFATRTDEKSVPAIAVLPEIIQTKLNSLIPV